MSEDAMIRHSGPKHQGPARTSPYATSRMAPAHRLVDLVAEIERADEMLQATAHGKLDELARQIRALQQRAHEVIAEARVDALLHRARCNFKKRVGAHYHLYRRDDGDHYFSMLSPEEWKKAPHDYVGTFRLEADRSWSSPEDPELKLSLADSLEGAA